MKENERQPKDRPPNKNWLGNINPRLYQMGMVLGRKHFRVRLECMVHCMSEMTIQAEDESQAKARALEALQSAAVSIDAPTDFQVGSDVGWSLPVDVKVIEVWRHPNRG
jgi:hypothetical protein